jgi:hypothetical protein
MSIGRPRSGGPTPPASAIYHAAQPVESEREEGPACAGRKTQTATKGKTIGRFVSVVPGDRASMALVVLSNGYRP